MAMDLATISEKMRFVLKELELVTDGIEAIQLQSQAIANDDFLTRKTAAPENDNT